MAEFAGEPSRTKRIAAHAAYEHLEAAEYHVSVIEEASDNGQHDRAQLAQLHALIGIGKALNELARKR